MHSETLLVVSDYFSCYCLLQCAWKLRMQYVDVAHGDIESNIRCTFMGEMQGMNTLSSYLPIRLHMRGFPFPISDICACLSIWSTFRGNPYVSPFCCTRLCQVQDPSHVYIAERHRLIHCSMHQSNYSSLCLQTIMNKNLHNKQQI